MIKRDQRQRRICSEAVEVCIVWARSLEFSPIEGGSWFSVTWAAFVNTSQPPYLHHIILKCARKQICRDFPRVSNFNATDATSLWMKGESVGATWMCSKVNFAWVRLRQEEEFHPVNLQLSEKKERQRKKNHFISNDLLKVETKCFVLKCILQISFAAGWKQRVIIL